jgi:quercetin dioxygenase-like cupin family protein
MSTTKTPTGTYPQHARAQLLDLEVIADRLLQELPGQKRKTETVAREAGVSIVVMAMEAGDEIKQHLAPGAVSIHLLRGHSSVNADGTDFDLRPAQVVFLQPSTPHSVIAVEQSVIVLTVTGGNDHL